MSDSANQDNQIKPPPPSADSSHAEEYVKKLSDLLEKDKLQIIHTDLSKFDPTSLQDHYKIELSDYVIEISHSKHPNSGRDSYVLLFTNIKKFERSMEKIILAFMHLNENQFKDLKGAAHNQLERKRRAEELKRFNEAVSPIDDLLTNLSEEKNDTEEIEENPLRPSALNIN